MSIRLAAFRLVKNGRLLIRHIHKTQQKKIASYNESVDGGAHTVRWVKSPIARPTFVQHVTSQARRVVVDAVLNRVTHTLASDLRRKVTKRLLFGDSTPFFALVGVSLASGAGILTKDDELEAVCWEIRDAVTRTLGQRLRGGEQQNVDVPEIGLESLELGPSLAKGCNAVVYAARWKDENTTEGGVTSNAHDFSQDPSILEYPLAVKMMFNYDAESNAAAVLHAMNRETVPAWCRDRDVAQLLDSIDAERITTLPPHANIVEMYRVFAAPVPCLPGSMTLYPDALPTRINPEGSGRNMSLFLIMKRYGCSLKGLLESGRPSLRVSHLLLAQLLEAVVHMGKNGVAHRDIKSDNLLLDWSSGEGESATECPVLAVSDFGCCLADSHHGLSLPFHTPHTERGGNAAHMPPEVACAQPGAFTNINYSKADLWSAGTIAYELFGAPNPFSGELKLSSRSYSESQLPALPSDVPAPLRSLVSAILSRNPAKRPSPEVAASVCQLLLWAPTEWLQGSPPRTPSSSELLQWLLSLATKVLCESGFLGRGRRTLPEYQLISSLLARASLQNLRLALSFIQHHLA